MCKDTCNLDRKEHMHQTMVETLGTDGQAPPLQVLLSLLLALKLSLPDLLRILRGDVAVVVVVEGVPGISLARSCIRYIPQARRPQNTLPNRGPVAVQLACAQATCSVRSPTTSTERK